MWGPLDRLVFPTRHVWVETVFFLPWKLQPSVAFLTWYRRAYDGPRKVLALLTPAAIELEGSTLAMHAVFDEILTESCKRHLSLATARRFNWCSILA